MEVGMAGRTDEDGVRLLERALRTKQLMEERRVQAMKDELLNEWGDSLDALQATWRPSATSMQTYSQNVSAYARTMRTREAEESKQRESFEIAKRTDSRIQRLALSESLRDSCVYVEHRAMKLDKAAASLPFGAFFTYQDLFHTDAMPEGVAPCLDACQGAPVRCSTFSRTGTVLATGDNSCTVRLWAKPKTAAQLAAEKAAKERQRAAEEAEREAARRLEEGLDATLDIGSEVLEKDDAQPLDVHTTESAPEGEIEDSAVGSSQDAADARAAHSGSAAAGEQKGDGIHREAPAANTAHVCVSQEDGHALTSEQQQQQQSAEADAPGGHAPCPPADAPAPQPAPRGAGAVPSADKASADVKDGNTNEGRGERGGCGKPWRSSQQLKGHKSPVTALVFVAQGELGPNPVLFTAAGDWKVVHWEPDDDGKWRVISELPVSHAAWIMDLCYVSRATCALSEARGPLLVTAAGDKSLKVLVHRSADKARRDGAPESPDGRLGAPGPHAQHEGAEGASAVSAHATPHARAPPKENPQQTPPAGTPRADDPMAAGEARQPGAASPMPANDAGLASRTQQPAGSALGAVAGQNASLLKSATVGAQRAPAARVSRQGSTLASPVAGVDGQTPLKKQGAAGASAGGSLSRSPAAPGSKAGSSAGTPSKATSRSRGSSIRGSPLAASASPLASISPARQSAAVAAGPREMLDSAQEGSKSAEVKPASDSKAESAAALTAASPLGGAKASGQAPDSSPQRESPLGSSSDVPEQVAVPQKTEAVVREWREVATLLGHRDSVFSVCCSQVPYTKHLDGQGAPQLLLASVGLDWSVRIWRMAKRNDPSNWECEATLMDATAAQYPGRPIQFMPQDPSIIVTANSDVVQLWHLAPGDTEDDVIVAHELVASLRGHMAPITCVQFRPDSKLIASCDTAGDVRLWKRDHDVGDASRLASGHEPLLPYPGGESQGVPEAGHAARCAGIVGEVAMTRAAACGDVPLSALKGARNASHDGEPRLCSPAIDQWEREGSADILRMGTGHSVRIDSPMSQRELLQERQRSQRDSNLGTSQLMILPDGDAMSDAPSRHPGSRASSPASGAGATNCGGVTRWVPFSRSYAGNANARSLAFGVNFEADLGQSPDGQSMEMAMLAVSNNKGRVRIWDTSKLLPLGPTLSDAALSAPPTRSATPSKPRLLTVVDKLSDLERGVRGTSPSWSNLTDARPGACLATFPNKDKIAAACYPDMEGGFLLWSSLPQPQRTAAPCNAGSTGVGAEERVFPHTAVVTCMAALHREFTNGNVSSYVVTGAADGSIWLTKVNGGNAPAGSAATNAGGHASMIDKPKTDRDRVVRRLFRPVHLADGEYAGPSRPAAGHGVAHSGGVLHIQVAGDGRNLLSSGQDGFVTIWDTATGSVVHNYRHVTPVLAVTCGFPSHPYCALASLFPPCDPGGTGQLVGEQRHRAGTPGEVIFINIAKGTIFGEPVKAHRNELVCLAMSPLHDGGVSVASCARDDQVIKITSMDDAMVIHELDASSGGTSAPVYVIKFDASGKLLASGDAQGLVRLWSPSRGTLIAELKGHPQSVLALDFSGVSTGDGRPISRAGPKTPSARELVTSDSDGQVRVWTFASFVEEKSLEDGEKESLADGAADSHESPEPRARTPSKGHEGVDRKVGKLVKSATQSVIFAKQAEKAGKNALLHKKQAWECSAVLQRESLVTQMVRSKVMSLCLDLAITRDASPKQLGRTGDKFLDAEEEEEDIAVGDDEQDDGDERQEGQERVTSPSTEVDYDSEEVARAINYNKMIKLAGGMDRIGLIDPSEDLEEAQARRTALWEERQREEALALMRLSHELRRKAERNRKPRTGPPAAPISVEQSVERRRAAAALLMRKMEETHIRDEPLSIQALIRLLDSSDDKVRAIAALGLGFLTSRCRGSDLALLEVDEVELEKARSKAEAAVLELQEVLIEVGEELEKVDGEHVRAKAAYRKAVREAAKDRKFGKEKRQKADRQKLIEAKAYRVARVELLQRYAGAFNKVLSSSDQLVPLQSAQVERLLVKCLGDPSSRVQECALYSLAQVAPAGHAPTAVAVAEKINSAEEAVRSAVGLCLGEIAQGLEEAVDVLLWLFDGQDAHDHAISSDHKRAALHGLALVLRSREVTLTRLRQKAMVALANLQDGDAAVREAAKRLSGYIARGDMFGLDGFQCQPDVLYQRPPFLASALVSYSATAADSDARPPFAKPGKRGCEPHSDMAATSNPPTINQGDRKQVQWPSMSRRLYGASQVNTAVQAPGVASSITRGGRPPQRSANMAPPLLASSSSSTLATPLASVAPHSTKTST